MNAIELKDVSVIYGENTPFRKAALNNIPELPKKTAQYLGDLGQSLGVFDLQGQLRGLESVRCNCMSAITEREQQRPQRVRSYETLGLCAGAALAILLI